MTSSSSDSVLVGVTDAQRHPLMVGNTRITETKIAGFVDNLTSDFITIGEISVALSYPLHDPKECALQPGYCRNFGKQMELTKCLHPCVTELVTTNYECLSFLPLFLTAIPLISVSKERLETWLNWLRTKYTQSPGLSSGTSQI